MVKQWNSLKLDSSMIHDVIGFPVGGYKEMDEMFCVRGNLDIVKCMQNNDDKYYLRILVNSAFSFICSYCDQGFP